MGLTNSEDGYGTLTKVFHWTIVILFALQYLGGNIMTAIGFNSSFAGISTNDYYNWHKSLGLVALVVAILRIINRQMGKALAGIHQHASTNGVGESHHLSDGIEAPQGVADMHYRDQSRAPVQLSAQIIEIQLTAGC